MTTLFVNQTDGTQADLKSSSTSTGLLYRTILSVVLLACSSAVFLLGANYGHLFPTNGDQAYTGAVTALFLIAALLLRSSPKLAKYWLVAFAFCIASSINFISSLFAGYNTDFLHLLGVSEGTNAGMALGKFYETLLVVIPIIGLTLVSGGSLGSLYLKRGNLNYKWGFGVGFLVLFNFLTSALIFFGMSYQVSKLGSAVLWGSVFAFSNSMLEELWVRGLFLKKLTPLVGAAGAVIISSIWFGAMHFLNVAYLPAAVVPVMAINTISLGVACSILMVKTDSIWGSFLVHASADIFLFIAILAIH
jgi:membrane protease YdiL (CAAX protease family)